MVKTAMCIYNRLKYKKQKNPNQLKQVETGWFVIMDLNKKIIRTKAHKHKIETSTPEFLRKLNETRSVQDRIWLLLGHHRDASRAPFLFSLLTNNPVPAFAAASSANERGGERGNGVVGEEGLISGRNDSAQTERRLGNQVGLVPGEPAPEHQASGFWDHT